VTELLPSALIIAFLAGVESLLSAMVADKMIKSSHRPNAEVLAQGFANIGSALFGGLPATGAIARTATNVRAGGKTPVAGLVHAATILAVTMMFGGLVGFLAMPALAALLMLTAYNMSEPHKWRGFLAAPNEERWLLLLTLTLTIFANLTIAIGVGAAIGLVIRLRKQGAPINDWKVPDR
jgi:SulP family sulfate permease